MSDPDTGSSARADSAAQLHDDAVTIDLTSAAPAGGVPPASPGFNSTSDFQLSDVPPAALLQPYIPDKQRDYVRLIVTVGLLLMLGWVVVWSCFAAASWKEHWAQTKEMLQTILPALTGLIGSVIGFYFGSGVNSTNTNSGNTNASK